MSELKHIQEIERRDRMERLLSRRPALMIQGDVANVALVTELVRSTGNILTHVDIDRDIIEEYPEEYPISRDEFTASVLSTQHGLYCNEVEEFCQLNLPVGDWKQEGHAMVLDLQAGLRLKVNLYLKEEGLSGEVDEFDADDPVVVFVDSLLQRSLIQK